MSRLLNHLPLAMLTLAMLAPAHGDTPAVPTAKATAFGEHAATVLVFFYTDCPVANGMAPELARIHETYADKDVAFYRVYADGTLTEQDIAKHGKDFKLPFPAVHDTQLEIVKLTGATITPEAVVYDRTGARRYRGRINNRYEDLGKYRREATRHDLREALDAVLAGKEVPTPETQAVGCYLPKPEDMPPAGDSAKEPNEHEATPNL